MVGLQMTGAGKTIVAVLSAVIALVANMMPAGAASCESLLTFKLTDAKVVSAATVNGTVVGPDGKNYTGLPAFCNLAILATPTSDSAINILLWIPTSTWNGRFEATGNGGYGGNMAIDAQALVYGLKHGFAVAATDMGTVPSTNNDADALIGHPEKWIDWGYRSTHLMTTLSKTLVKALHGRAPRYSYFNGCSTGGQQALLLAQRYPKDYDGILGGAPAHDRTHVHTAVLWLFAQTHKNASSYITPDKVSLINSAILKACVVKSGGLATDGFLTDPRKCNWSPRSIQCTSTTQSNCLNADQARAAVQIYRGAHDPVTGKEIFPGSPKGSEASSSFGWNSLQSGVEPNFGSMFKWVFGPSFIYSDFDFHQDMKDMDKVLAAILNDVDPDLSAFKASKGKLLMYHGWADPLVAPQSSIDYYGKVVAAQGDGKFSASALRETQKFARLFMVPGMNHCHGGPGPHVFGNEYSGNIVINEPPKDDSTHHALQALIDWVERGRAPEQLIATKYVNDTPGQGIAMQRPLCPYPQIARYSGHGSTNQAKNFVCVDER